MPSVRVAIAPFLRFCPEVITLGVRACIGDYSEEEKALLRNASLIFYPTPRFSNTFEAAGKEIFPSAASCTFQHSRLHRELLFQVLNLPHPKSRIFFGSRQKASIPSHFAFPLLATGPSASSPVHLVEDLRGLRAVARKYNPLIVREETAWDERLRFIFIKYGCAGIQRLESGAAAPGTWTPVLGDSARVREIAESSERMLRSLGVDEIALEWGRANDKWQICAMARPPLRWMMPEGEVNRFRHVAALIGRSIL